MRISLRVAAIGAALLLRAPLCSSAPAAPAAPTGRWYAVLTPVDGLEIGFGIRVDAKGGALSGALVNGASESRFTRVTWAGGTLGLDLDHYDARLAARVEGEGLVGTFVRETPRGKIEAPFRATRRAPTVPVPPKGSPSLSGDWGVEMGEGEKAERLLGTFRQEGGNLAGTLLGLTGDYGPMHGTCDGKAFALTVFDGVFVYRLEGVFGEAGTIAGTFRTRSGASTPWRARRLDAAGAAAWLPGGGSIVRAKDPDAPVRFSYPSGPGTPVSLDDPAFRDRPVVVTILGSWCPNCHDEAPALEEVWRKYRGKGLAVVALAYEYTEDPERSFRQIARFRERHGITFPILFAGTTKGAAATEPLARLEGWKGYPTTLFLDRTHRIVKAHSGFDGPSSGDRHAAQKRELEESVKAILAR